MQAIRLRIPFSLSRFKKPRWRKPTRGKTTAMILIGVTAVFLNSFMVQVLPFFWALGFSILYSAMPTLICGLAKRFIFKTSSTVFWLIYQVLIVMIYGVIAGVLIGPFVTESLLLSVRDKELTDNLMVFINFGANVSSVLWTVEGAPPAASE